MKKIIAVLLLLAMLLTLVACANNEEAETSSSSEDAHHDHVHISYRGVSHRFSLEEMEQIEGKPCDFNTDAGGTTIYVYNDISFDEMSFTQLQYTFSETTTRISCTYTADKEHSADEIAAELDGVWQDDLAVLEGLFGEGNSSEESSTISWHDDIGNYILMAQLNDTTIQVCFYLCAE